VRLENVLDWKLVWQNIKMLRISRQPSSVQTLIDQKQLENLKYFKYLGSVITNDASCAREIKSRTVTVRAAFSKKQNLFTSKLDSHLSA